MKKSSINKGLIFVFLILAIIGSALIFIYTRENMTLKVIVYDYRGPVEGAMISIDGENKLSNSDGSADFSMLVKLDETLKVNVNHNEKSISTDFTIDSVRFTTGYSISRIILE